MKNVLLIGLGRFGRNLAEELNELGHQIMAVDVNEELVNECMPFVTNAQIGDSTKPEFLRTLGIDNYDICYVTISGDFQDSLETTSLLKEMGAKFVVARAERSVQEKFLLRNGADAVTYPEKQVAKWAAIRYCSNNLLNYIEIDDEYSVVEVPVPKAWRGRSIEELNIRKSFGINILGVKKDGKMNMSVMPGTVMTENMTVMALGTYSMLKKCFEL